MGTYGKPMLQWGLGSRPVIHSIHVTHQSTLVFKNRYMNIQVNEWGFISNGHKCCLIVEPNYRSDYGSYVIKLHYSYSLQLIFPPKPRG